jgi:hypothetical protein
MSITPARPVVHTSASAEVASTAREGEAPGAESHAVSERQSSINHLEHRQRVHGANWFGSNQRAMPQVTLGMRDGALIPPRGSLVNRTGTAATRAMPLKNAAARAAKGAGRSSQSAAHGEGVEEEEEGQGMVATESFGDAAVPLPTHAGQGMGSDAGTGDGSAPMGLTEFLLARDAAEARASQGHPRGTPLTSAASGATDLSPPQALEQMLVGQVCWATNLRLAMQCAQMHPGGDIFVQAFTVADSEGHIIPAFSKRVRLRADAGGTVVARAHHESAAAGAENGAQSRALLDELGAAPLLGLSIAEVLDERGEPVSALANLQAAELDQLRRLFARGMAPATRSALVGALAGLAQIKQTVFENPDLGERIARHGDALERAMHLQRTSPSETIRNGGTAAYRAEANWQHAQAQVAAWAQRGRPPAFDSLLRLNLMLGEGMKPWNRAEQADRVGARFGVLRHFDVVAGVPPQYFVRADQVPQAMVELFEWLESQQRAPEPAFTAAQVHQRLVSIHPFADANGRTARLAMDWLLQLQGWPPALLPPGEYALFAHRSEATNPPAGAAEAAVVEGLRLALTQHLNWLQLDAAPS